MLDINLLRKDLPTAIARLEARKTPQTFLNVDAFQALEAERKALQIRTEELQNQRNSLSKQIGQLKAKGEDASAVMAQVSGFKAELEASSVRLDQIQSDMQALRLAARFGAGGRRRACQRGGAQVEPGRRPRRRTAGVCL